MDFQAIYTEYFTIVYRYALALTGNAHLAEEITQETFFKALKNLKRFRGDCDVRVWLCQIAKNTYFSVLRKQKRTVSYEEDALSQHVGDAGPEEDLLKRDAAIRIHKILHQLAEPYREVFTLRTFGELSFREIAQIFEKSENWARVCYHRAKIKIREEMEREDNM